MATAVSASVAAGAADGRRRWQRRLDYPDVERSSLHRALDEGRYQSVVYQVKLGMDPNVRSRQGLTLLMRCARVRPPATSLQLIRVLLERGANPDLTDARGNNLLQLAVREGNVALVRLLLTENNVNFYHRDSDGDTVLHLLAGQSADLCRMVLLSARRFHIDSDVANAEGITPMMAACRAGNLPVAELFATLGGASFTKRDPGQRRTAQDWLLASVGPGGMALKMEQLRRGQEAATSASAPAVVDPYEKIRQSRRVETLTRLFQSRHQQLQQQQQPQLVEGEMTQPEAEDVDAATERPGTAAAAGAARSVARSESGRSQLMLPAALRRSRTQAPLAPPVPAGGQSRLLSGIFCVYEMQLSASYRRPAVPLPASAFAAATGPDFGGQDDSRPLSRVSSGRSQRSPALGAAGGSGLSRRMTEFAGTSLRLKQRIRSGVRHSEADAGTAASSLLLNMSQDSGGLRRLSSRT